MPWHDIAFVYVMFLFGNWPQCILSRRTVCDLLHVYSTCQGLVILRNLLSHLFKERNITKAYELLPKMPTFVTFYSILKQIDRFDARKYMSSSGIRIFQTSTFSLTLTLLRNLQKTRGLLRQNVRQRHVRSLNICIYTTTILLLLVSIICWFIIFYIVTNIVYSCSLTMTSKYWKCY